MSRDPNLEAGPDDARDAGLSALYAAHLGAAAPHPASPSSAVDERLRALARAGAPRAPRAPSAGPAPARAGWWSWLTGSWTRPGFAFAAIACVSAVIVALMPRESIDIDREAVPASAAPGPAPVPDAGRSQASAPNDRGEAKLQQPRNAEEPRSAQEARNASAAATRDASNQSGRVVSGNTGDSALAKREAADAAATAPLAKTIAPSASKPAMSRPNEPAGDFAAGPPAVEQKERARAKVAEAPAPMRPSAGGTGPAPITASPSSPAPALSSQPVPSQVAPSQSSQSQSSSSASQNAAVVAPQRTPSPSLAAPPSPASESVLAERMRAPESRRAETGPAATGLVAAPPPAAASATKPGSPAPNAFPGAALGGAARADKAAEPYEKPSLITEPADSRAAAPLPEVRDGVSTYSSEVPAAIPLPGGAPTRGEPPGGRAAAQATRKEAGALRRSFEGQTSAVSPAHRDPAEWVRALQKLRSEGKLEQLAKELAEFRKTFPVYALPDDLKPYAPR